MGHNIMKDDMKVSLSNREVALEEQIKEIRRKKISAFKSQRGLTPDEIYFLSYSPKFKVDETQFQQFWLYEFAIDEPDELLKKLAKMELIEPANIKSSLDKLKVSELKEILTELGEKITGRKAELVSRVAQAASEEYLESKIRDRYYQLTELGLKELKENNYVVYFGQSRKYGFDIWEMNRKIGNGDPQRYRDIIWGTFQDTNQKAMKALNNGDYSEFLSLSILNNLNQYDFLLEEEKTDAYNIAFRSLALAVYYKYKFDAAARYISELDVQKYDSEYVPEFNPYIDLSNFRYLKECLHYSDNEMFDNLQKIFDTNGVDISRYNEQLYPSDIISNFNLAGMIVSYSNGDETAYNDYLSETPKRLNLLYKTQNQAVKRAKINVQPNYQQHRPAKKKESGVIVAIAVFAVCIGISTIKAAFNSSKSSTPTVTTSDTTIAETARTAETTTQEETTVSPWGIYGNPDAEYFEANQYINEFFIRYNDVASEKIEKENISQGNIRIKAYVSQGPLYMYLINPNNAQTSVIVDANCDNDEEKLYEIYQNCVKIAMPDIGDDELKAVWEEIHENEYGGKHSFDQCFVEYQFKRNYENRISVTIDFGELECNVTE